MKCTETGDRVKPALRPPLRRGLFLGASGLALLGIVLVVWLWPGDGEDASRKIVAHDYSGRPTVCLAADDSVASAQIVQHTWTVLQQAGLDNPVNVQQLVVPAKDSDEAAPYLSGLIAQHCTMIVTAGNAFNSALPSILKTKPRNRFVSIAPTAELDLAGATALTADQLSDRLAKDVHDLAPEH